LSRLTAADDGALVDGAGRRVALRGVNLGGRAKRPPYLPFELSGPDATPDEVSAQAEALCKRAASWGCDVARVLVSWAALEPARGYVDRRYLARLGLLLDAAHGAGLGVILDFHQDLYAAPLGGDGFPVWALPPALRAAQTGEHRLWFAQYALDARVHAAYDHFWRDADGLHAAFLQMWRTFLGALGEHPAVLGVDLFNEPGWGEAGPRALVRDTLEPFYTWLIASLRADWPDLLYLYGSPGIEMMGLGKHDHRPAGEQVVYAPHLYDPALVLCPAGGVSVPPARQLDALARWRAEAGTPVVITELGVTHGAVGGAAWLGQVCDGLDRHHLSAMIWEASLTSALWRGEDLNLLGPDGADRPAARAWARPRVAALAGEGLHVAWDGERFGSSWRADGRAATWVRLPAGEAWRVEEVSAGAHVEWVAGGLLVEAARGQAVRLMVSR
jgi:endoglycosylceramidase